MKEDRPETPSKEGPNAVKDMSIDPVETSSSSPSSKTSSPSSFQTPYTVIWKHLDDTRGFASDKLSGQFRPAVGSESNYKYCTPEGRESRKLNFGNNSNIWLVSHRSGSESTPTFRAVKVLRAGHQVSGHGDETSVYNKILEHLTVKRASTSTPSQLHPGLKNLVRFYGKLHVQLPLDNVHDGYVLEPLTVDLHCLLSLVSSNHDAKRYPAQDLRLDLEAERSGLPIEVVKRFTKGILNGLGFLHGELGLIYAGLKACNIAFRLTDMDKWVREAGAHQEKSEESMMRFCEQATVVLTDFGRSMFEGSDQIARFNNSFVPPEHRLLRTGKVTTAADIWGVGTIAIAMITGKSTWLEKDTKDEWYSTVREVIGDAPTRYLVDCNMFSQGHRKNKIAPGLSTWLKNHLPKKSQNLSWKSFLSSCFQWEPERRPKAQELLKYQLFIDVADTDSAGNSGYIPAIEGSDAMMVDTPALSAEPLVQLRSCVNTPGYALTGPGSERSQCFCKSTKDYSDPAVVTQSLRDAGYTAIVAAGDRGNESLSWLCSTKENPDRLVAVKILNRDHDRDLKNQAQHIGILKQIAARRQNPGYFGHNNIVEFHKEIPLDIDRMGYVHEPLSISLAQAVSEGLLPLPMPMGLVARTVMGVLSGLKFLHDEMKLVYAGLEMQSIVFRLEDWPKGMNSKPTQRLHSFLSGESPSIELFGESATVILADFGRCACIDAGGRAPVSIPPAISPPEKVLAGHTMFTPGADIWGVGVLMASMLMTDSRQWFPLQNSTEEWSKAVESLLGPIPTDLNGDTARGEAQKKERFRHLIKWLSKPKRNLDPKTTHPTAGVLNLFLAWHPGDRLSAAMHLNATTEMDHLETTAVIDPVEMDERIELRSAGIWTDILQPEQEAKYEEMLPQRLYRRDLDDIHNLGSYRRRARVTIRGPPPETSLESSRLLARIDDDLFELHNTTYSVTSRKAIPDVTGMSVPDSVKIPSFLPAEPSPSTPFEPSRYSDTWKYINMFTSERDRPSSRSYRPPTDTVFCTPTCVSEYKLVRKLNHGNNSNIWLLSQECVTRQTIRAIKIIRERNEGRGHGDEFPIFKKILEHVRKARSGSILHSGTVNIVRFYGKVRLDERYDCYLLEPLTIDLETLLELTHHKFVYYEDPSEKDRAADHRLPSWFIKQCAYGILNGIDFLHRELRLIYAGLKPCNIAFRLSNMKQLAQLAVNHEQGEQDEGPWSDRPEAGSPDKGGEEKPIYRPRKPILGPLGLSKSSLNTFCEMATIVLTDFGRSQFVDVENDNVPQFNPVIAPPENVLTKSKASIAGDIWGVGTVIVTMLLNRPFWVKNAILKVDWYSTIRLVIGDIPKDVRGTYGDATINMIEQKIKSSSGPRLSSWLASRLPDDPTKVASWESFLNSCMAWDPESRSSAETLLCHQLFAEINKDSAVPAETCKADDHPVSAELLVHMYTCTQSEGALPSERIVRCACHPSRFFEPKPRISSSYKLHGSDYTAIRKIKEDFRSSTWLCKSESKPNDHVAIKILVRDRDPASKEHRQQVLVLDSIAARLKQGHKAVDNIVKFYNTLQLDVDRTALVFEPLSLDLERIEYISRLQILPGWFIKKCNRGILRGLAFLHDEMKVVHAGLEARHISFRLPELQYPAEPPIVIDKGEESAGRLGRSFPHIPSPRRFYEEATVVLSDFDRSAFIGSQSDTAVDVHCSATPPEMVLARGIRYGTSGDIWQVGVLTLSMLGYGGAISDLASISQWYRCFTEYLGEVPEDVVERYGDIARRLQSAFANGNVTHKDLADQLYRRGSIKEEAVEWDRFLRRCLAWFPEDRPSAAELQLDHIFTGAFYRYPSSSNDAEPSGTDEALHASKEEEMNWYTFGCDLDDLHQPFDGSIRLKLNPPARPLDDSRLLARIDNDLFQLHEQTSSFVALEVVESDATIQKTTTSTTPLVVEIDFETYDHDKDYNDDSEKIDGKDDNNNKHDEQKQQAQNEDQDQDQDQDQENEHDETECNVTAMTVEL